MSYKVVEITEQNNITANFAPRIITKFNKLALAKNFIKAYAKVLSKSATKITVADDHIEAVMPNNIYKVIEITK